MMPLQRLPGPVILCLCALTHLAIAAEPTPPASQPAPAGAGAPSAEAAASAAGEAPPPVADPSEVVTQAREAYQRGERAFNAGDFAAARGDFLRAYELSHRPALLYNLALVASRQGDNTAAAQYLTAYLASEPRDAEEAQAWLERLRTAVKPHPKIEPPARVEPPARGRSTGAAFIGAKLGALLPQAFSPLGASFYTELEGGYLLPPLRRAFSVHGSFAVALPQLGGTIADPRVAGGSYSYEQPSQQFLLGLTVLCHVPLGRLQPYLGVGPRLSIVRTVSSGMAQSGAAIPTSVETSTQPGIAVPLGLDVQLGPGRLFVELQLLYAASPQASTGSGNFGSLTAAAGYRMVF